MAMLSRRWDESKFVCVGLDSNAGQLPVEAIDLRDYSTTRKELRQAVAAYQSAEQTLGGVAALEEEMRVVLANAIGVFNQKIIEATGDLVCAFKLNIAFYEPLGEFGPVVLQETIAYIHQMWPEVPVIVDWKRGDILNTNLGYVLAQGLLGADAVTISPYLGYEALAPFFADPKKGVFVLCKTSNEGAGEFQDRVVKPSKEEIGAWDLPKPYKYSGFDDDSDFYPEMPLYQLVAYRVSREWNANGNCGLVVGATYPKDLTKVRKIVGDGFPLLLPGIGAQGGELEATVKAGADSRGQGMVINDSRKSIFASSGKDFAGAARRRVESHNHDITAALAT